MKSTGIVRRIDDLGRIVLPKELRTMVDVSEGQPLEFFVDGDAIMLRKYTPGCVFCGEASGTSMFKGKWVCTTCRNELS